MSVFLSVEGCDCFDMGGGVYRMTAFGRIDSDGTGAGHGDHSHQRHTSYQPDLNADVDQYVVLPPQLRINPPEIMLGCKVFVENLRNGKSTWAVAGDVGPKTRAGEMSIACAKAIGLDPSPVSGGSNARTIRYTFHGGVAACVNGRQYKLQPA